MKKILLFLIALLLAGPIFAQKKDAWHVADLSAFSGRETIRSGAYSENQKFFTFDVATMKNMLVNVSGRFSGQAGVRIAIPTISGNMEEFMVWENSNFEPELQAKYPEIRSYIGRGITDSTAKLYFSLAPEGIQTMILRADKGSEFIEPYTKDRAVYVMFDSDTRLKNSLPLVCSTEEKNVSNKISSNPSVARSNNGSYKTMRLALSCTGEYGTYHGGTAGALAAMNATMTRVNGVYDIDLAVHLNLIANNNVLVYTNATTDGYSNAANMDNWNLELQAKLTSIIGNANYDIGHLFGATGGGGNAGCIGCVCVAPTNTEPEGKGSGITSPEDGVPMGDTFDIDYVAHEMGHQLGGTHSYSHIYEASGTNVEPGSGSTIMGYAGITGSPTDVQAHSNDYFTYVNIAQIQQNLAGKSCPVSTPITNTPPVVDAGASYTIPKGTPFILTGSATDAEGDSLEYTWEQNDDSTQSLQGNASIASATKTAGPTFRSFSPTTSPIRYCPSMSKVLSNNITSAFESVSNVARNLNFTLTARDNSVNGPQTNTAAMAITVTTAAGPFAVTAPNSVVTWQAGSNQTVTWNVAGTTGNGVDTPFVDIYLSNNAGVTFGTLLASHVPNDGSETITIPNTPGTSNRIMVRANGNIFFDVSNTNFAISAPVATQSIAFTGDAGEQFKTVCGQASSINFIFDYLTLAGFTGTTTFSATGNPAGSTVSFNPTSATANGEITMSVSGLDNSATGTYPITVTSTSGSITKTINFYLQIQAAVAPVTTTTPVNLATDQLTDLAFTWQAADVISYVFELATDVNFNNIIVSENPEVASYNAHGLMENTDYYWRVAVNNGQCLSAFSAVSKFTTGNFNCNSYVATNVPMVIGTGGNITINSTMNISDNVSIRDLDLTVDITHSWISDLRVSLVSPGGTVLTLIANQCNVNPGVPNMNVTFDDLGSFLVCGTNPAISGTIKPLNALSNFNNISAQGNWTLRILDNQSGDGGTLNSWSMKVCSAAPLGIEDKALFSFAVYPNPNNGSFTVKSDKLTSDKINMAVYDIRGRIIFQKDYAGSANFNENIKLDNVQSGVYLLSVSDGQNKEVKRIVVQ
ncbi:zinc-dependent metalloprotease [Flavobacterium pallidum]|uniref:Propanediol utilization protein n=1 Tax=Flavobacterium pallidum TaxID=2172098 RepID=A0A2S1SG12_9FLAO|nr:zinc-dependent metalloprotease family protein [Flavobacterium pallidum]AWI25348.1 propanediol utilization protein [Flavobacterium pallidum]